MILGARAIHNSSTSLSELIRYDHGHSYILTSRMHARAPCASAARLTWLKVCMEYQRIPSRNQERETVARIWKVALKGSTVRESCLRWNERRAGTPKRRSQKFISTKSKNNTRDSLLRKFKLQIIKICGSRCCHNQNSIGHLLVAPCEDIQATNLPYLRYGMDSQQVTNCL